MKNSAFNIEKLRMFGIGFIIIVIVLIISLVGYRVQGGKDDDQDIVANNKNDMENIFTEIDKIITPQVRQPTAEEAEKYPLLTNIPALYIETEYKMSRITKEEYLPATYTLVYEDGSGIFNESMMMKGRGNFQWAMPKKPFTVKLTRDAPWLGMKSAKKWNLLGEYVDKTLLRNYLTFSLAIEAGLDNTLDWRFVDVFLNGKYNGNYMITESIQIHENRINIDKKTEGIFEIEAVYRHDDHRYCVIMNDDYHHIMYKKPEEDNIGLELKLENLEKFKVFFKEMEDSLSEGYGEYSKYIDVDSFVSWYLVNEFCKNYDSGFTSSCYCYIKDGKVYMGPVWDYHTCYGSQEVATCINPKGYHVSGSPWYGKLMKDKTFSQFVRDKWTQMRNDRVFEDFVDSIDNMINYMSDSIDKNFEVWPGALKESGLRGRKSKFTFDDEIEYLRNWIYDRIAWLDGEWYGK